MFILSAERDTRSDDPEPWRRYERYPEVFRYELGAADASAGHRDWRYDEFRIGDDGRLIHEIEWWGPGEVARWLIEANDVEFSWHPAPGSSDTRIFPA